MQRYYFDINDGRTRSRDTEGQELPSLEAARKLAAQELAHIIRDELPDGQRESYAVTVRDSSDRPVYIAMSVMLGEHL